MNVFNPQFRAQFPALQDAGVYLDSAATALKPEAVVEATQQFYSLSAGNVHRSQFAEAQRLTARYEAAREKVAQLLNAPDDKTIVWTGAAPLNPSTWWHNVMRVRVCNRAMRLLSAWQNTTLTSSPG
ncbi:aminotransferase class V-fold PLP-dependent enzyme [Escherichia coli]